MIIRSVTKAACMHREESQHQPETAANAAVDKYFDGSRVVAAAGEAEGGVDRKAPGSMRGRRGEEEEERKTVMSEGSRV